MSLGLGRLGLYLGARPGGGGGGTPIPENPWSIPALSAPVYVNLPTNYYSVNHSGQNVILKGPLATRTSSMQVLGANAVIMYGVDQTVSPGSGGTANFIRDVVNDLWIEGCRIRMGTMGDAFKAGGNVGSNAAPTAIPTVTFVNVHISGVRGLLDDTHGDGYQADFHSLTVRMFNVIIETSYQGVFFDPTAANVASRPIIKEGTDLRHCCFRLTEYDGFTDLNSLIYYADNVSDALAGPPHIVDDVTLVVPTGFDPLRAVRPMIGATLNSDAQGQYITLDPSLSEKIIDTEGNPAKFRVVYDAIPARYNVPPAIGYELDVPVDA